MLCRGGFAQVRCWCCRSCSPSSLFGHPWSPTSRLAPPRAVAAERVMPPRGCFAAWASTAALVVSLDRFLPSRLHLPSRIIALLQLALQVALLGLWWRALSLFSCCLLLCCCVWGANHSLCGSVSLFVFAVLSTSFFLMQRHMKLCSEKKTRSML
jgi:hypothetical protein